MLPFLMPRQATPVYSTAWLGGADNRAATVALALLSCLVLLITSLRNREPVTEPATEPLGRLWLLLSSFSVTLWTLFWGFAIVRSGLRVGETNYFLEQTRNAAGIGLAQPMRIYHDLEFPYGPLLLEPAVWLWRLGHGHLPLASCYVLTLAAWNVLGLALVYFSLNRLPLQTWARRLLFALCVFETLHPLFGPNYSLGKFALPMAALLWAASIRDSLRRALALAAGLFVCLLVSPELAIGLAASIVVLAGAHAVRTPFHRGGWLFCLLAVPAAYGGFLLLYGPAFLDRLHHASGGALNLVIQPLPDMLVFCFAVLWLAPVAVGLHLVRPRIAFARRNAVPDDGPTLLALFVLALGFLPGALGRADPLHVFFNGLPILVLSTIALGRLSTRGRLLWATSLVVLALQVQAANYEMYARSLRDVLAAQRHPPAATLDIGHLARETGGLPVAAPALYGIALPDELALRRAHLLVLDPAPGLAEIWDATSEEQHIARLRQSQWALVPLGNYLITERLTRQPHPLSGSLPRRLLQSAGHALLGFSYPERHTPFSVGALTQQEIASNWSPIDRLGSLELYRRIR